MLIKLRFEVAGLKITLRPHVKATDNKAFATGNRFLLKIPETPYKTAFPVGES
jgi:hypothetical protein